VTPLPLWKRLKRRVLGAPPAYPPWEQILSRDARRWRAANAAAQAGPRVLIATSFGGHLPSVHLETTLAVALTLRGARVHLLLCDGFLPACQQAEIGLFDGSARAFAEAGPQGGLCAHCWTPSSPVYRGLGLPVHIYSELVTSDEIKEARTFAAELPMEDIEGFRFDDIAVGEHAFAGALRFFARGDLDRTEPARAVSARYFEAALLTVFAVRRLVRSADLGIACFNHGIYVPQGLIGEVVRSLGRRVVNWNPAYRKGCFIFSHGDTYHHTLLDEPSETWQDMPWSEARDTEIVDYLESRRYGSRDWIWFHERPQEALDVIEKDLDIDLTKPTIGLLTNVIWDAQLHYRANAFPSMMDWVNDSIAYFAQRTDLQLLIRVHPAEIRGTVPSRQRVVEEIERRWGSLPGNVFVIPPESPISTYAAMDQCNAVLIYGTKTGVELTARGIPVIVAGEAWIRNKGLTMDASSPGEYFALLDRLPLPSSLEEETITLARKYAYHFFFRRMIPVRAMKPTGSWPPYRAAVRTLEDLAPGRDPGLDTICEGILNERAFVHDPSLSDIARAARS
jgi:hypothetical protein